jgi:hypothetical protein
MLARVVCLDRRRERPVFSDVASVRLTSEIVLEIAKASLTTHAVPLGSSDRYLAGSKPFAKSAESSRTRLKAKV